MPKTSPRQRKTTGRVMHEYKHGELRSGPGGKGGKVKSRRQAIAIALKEAGASKYESKRENKKNLAKTERKEARGATYQQERKDNRMSALTAAAKVAAPWAGTMRVGGLRAAARPPSRERVDRSVRRNRHRTAPRRHRRPFKNEQAPTRERAALGARPHRHGGLAFVAR